MHRYFIIILFLQASAFAQPKALKTGDVFHGLYFDELYNSANKSFSEENLKNKIVVLDFWSVHCTSCVYAFPKLDYLQEKFKQDVQIILATFEREQNLKTFLDRSPFMKQMRMLLPIARLKNDSLRYIFPHKSIPHVVVIGKDRVIKAITGQLTEDMLSKLIRNEPLIVENKDDFSERHDAFTPSRAFGSKMQLPASGRYTLFSDYQEGAMSMLREEKDTINNMLYISYQNVPINKLFAKTYPSGNYNYYRLSAIINNTRFGDTIFCTNFSGYDQNVRRNLYCYARNFPLSIPENDRKRMMRKDLEEYFAIKTHIESRKVDLYTLQRIAKPGVGKKLVASAEDTVILISSLLSKLENSNTAKFFVADEGVSAETLVRVHRNAFKDLALLNKNLASQGLEFKKTEKNIDALVFEDIR